MDAALHILAITGPIYLTIALGYLLTRRGLFAKADMALFGKFTLHLALPALLFNALSRRSVAEVLNLQYLAAYALASVVLAMGSYVWARRMQHDEPGLACVKAMGMACPNSGFVGYPIMLLTLGPVAGVALALNMVVENLLVIPLLLGVAESALAGGRSWTATFQQTFRQLLTNPLIIAIVCGFLVSLSGLQVPVVLSRSIDLFAGASAVLSLFVIGGSLVGLQLQGQFGTMLQIALGKLLLHPLLMLGVSGWLITVAPTELRTALLITGALPMMGIYTILSQRLGHGEISAATLLLTTVLSFVSLSGLLWALQSGLL